MSKRIRQCSSGCFKYWPKKKLLKGTTIGVDATTLEANAALRSIVRRDTGERYEEFLTRLAKESGIETPTREQLAKLDRKRTKKGSNEDWSADDYMVKPFGTRELLARIRALLRRTSPDDTKVLTFADVDVDLTRRIVSRRGEELKLTRAEYNLLTYFLQNPDRALTRDVILNSAWGYESFPNTRTVDAHVVRLRQKLEPDPGSPRHFLTVHGVGYRFLP